MKYNRKSIYDHTYRYALHIYYVLILYRMNILHKEKTHTHKRTPKKQFHDSFFSNSNDNKYNL